MCIWDLFLEFNNLSNTKFKIYESIKYILKIYKHLRFKRKNLVMI